MGCPQPDVTLVAHCFLSLADGRVIVERALYLLSMVLWREEQTGRGHFRLSAGAVTMDLCHSYRRKGDPT